MYDGDPQWSELELEYEDFRTFSVGILDLRGDETIFPVDGQHRVEGIRKAEVKNFMLFCADVEILSDNAKESMLRYWAASYGKDTLLEDELLAMIDEASEITVN